MNFPSFFPFFFTSVGIIKTVIRAVNWYSVSYFVQLFWCRWLISLCLLNGMVFTYFKATSKFSRTTLSRAPLNSRTCSNSCGHRKVREFKYISSAVNWIALTFWGKKFILNWKYKINISRGQSKSCCLLSWPGQCKQLTKYKCSVECVSPTMFGVLMKIWWHL